METYAPVSIPSGKKPMAIKATAEVSRVKPEANGVKKGLKKAARGGAASRGDSDDNV